MKIKAADAILARLREAGRPLPVHELNIMGVSENGAATRLAEMARQGLVIGVPVPGKRFKSWTVADGRLPL